MKVDPAPHLIERRSSDYVRRGTTTQFVALEIATGHIAGALNPRRRRQDFFAFLGQVARAHPEVELHLVMDNDATRTTPRGPRLAERQPRVRVHFTPTHASWMNLVEVWLSIIERQAIHRGTYRSAEDLNAKVPLVRSCAESGTDVAVDDVVLPADAEEVWHSLLNGLAMQLVVVLPSLGKALARGGRRDKHVQVHRVRTQHDGCPDGPVFDTSTPPGRRSRTASTPSSSD